MIIFSEYNLINLSHLKSKKSKNRMPV